ncbi:MAG: DNA helicase PcrA [Firmicutes bacterium]|nr:DNA helicase PcrA [Bacillota bacterium]
MNTDLLKALNKEQREAVLHTEGPLLILAGAGSGKTRVITYRIAYLIKEKGVQPENILAITFTNKAAGEMKGRVDALVGEVSENMWISTFHSACVRILRRDIEKIGFDRNFIIFDTSDQQVVIRDCLKELNLDEKTYTPVAMLSSIGRAKDEMLEPDEFARTYEGDFRMSTIAKVYKLYQKKLKQNNALDFDDIIVYTVKLFQENPPVLAYYQRRFKYIHVDEYQDTNTAQYKLVSFLAHLHRNLCVVGDDDQSIYGFRGANIRNILDFEKEFKDAKVVKLEQNYRSTKIILDAANSVIRNNKGRKHKVLWTDNNKGCKIQCYQGQDEHDEAYFIASEINKSVRFEKKNYKDFAVLYRMNAQSRVLEEMFIREGIPYRIFGGLRFYDRKEIKDVLAYLRLIQNLYDNYSLKRIINVPKRGIGNATVEKLDTIADREGCSIFEAINSAHKYIELQRVVPRLEEFRDLIVDLRNRKETITVSQLIDEVIEKSGILEELQNENTAEAQSRIENIKELISAALEFENKNEDKGLDAFLAHISLVADIDNLDEEKNNVVLMTFHSAKGLEFPIVFMAGMEEQVFPGYRSLYNKSELEEERRLCYVGITRAKEKLYMTYTNSRTLFGKTTNNMVSRFIEEIPEKLLEGFYRKNEDDESDNEYGREYFDEYEGGYYKNKFGYYRNKYDKSYRGYNSDGYSDEKNTGNYKLGKNWKNNASKKWEFNTSNKGNAGNVDFKVGDKVIHKKFGKGIITSIEKDKDDYKLEIVFNGVGMKRLMAAYANLEKISGHDK